MAEYPGDIWAPAPNVDNTTEIDKEYMDQRDAEIVAIENALGKDLVPSGEKLKDYVQVSPHANRDLLLADTSTTRIGIGCGFAQGTYAVDTKVEVAEDQSGTSRPTILRLRAASFGAQDRLDLGYHSVDEYGYIQADEGGQGCDLAINPNGGDVGIGTTDPLRQLHLKRNSTGDSELRVENFNDDTDSSARVILRLSNRWHSAALVYNAVRHATYPRVLRLANNDPQGDIRFYTNSADRVVIDTDGDVGIGTMQPTAQLHVADHTIRIEGSRSSAPGSGDGNVGDITWVDEVSERELYVKVTSGAWKKVSLT